MLGRMICGGALLTAALPKCSLAEADQPRPAGQNGMAAGLPPSRGTPAALLAPPLRWGINITGWFRFPGSRDARALVSWMPDTALADLHRAGFDFIRLAVDPALLERPDGAPAVVAAVQRIERHGLAAVVSLHPQGWHLESDPADAARLLRVWAVLAPALRALPPALTCAELLNEPVFPGDAAGWAALQHRLLGSVRAALPHNTVVLTGADWGSIAGLCALKPEPDPNVVYSFHFYNPVELTSLAAWRGGLDRSALAGLPFPVKDPGACRVPARDAATQDVVAYYCASGWNGEALRRNVAQARDWAVRHGVRLLAGEFGATAALNPEARLACLRASRIAFEEAGIGWALWGLDDVMGFSVPRPPPPHPVLDPAVLRALGLSPGVSPAN